ncbi:MAG: Rpn family recombination-promoting nuclease/putative transposase [Oscillospiraceae bacterium]|nr:Rpn family recombination-promoting nuclease/putative transposase [Oscillospiraceae bacterium]
MENDNIKILSPKSDIIFKLLFGDERSVEFLTDFLKSVLRIPEDDYGEVIIVNPFLLQDYDGDKLGILDVKIKTKSKKIIDIEIQVKPTSSMKERVVFYSSKMVTEQVGSGGKYQQIKKVISIIITDYILIADSPKYHHRFTLYDRENNVEFTDIIEVNTLELNKLPEVADGTSLWEWMKFLNAESKEEFDMVAEKNPVIKKAVVRLAELSQDERTRMLYESRQKLEWDIWSREREAAQNTMLSVAKNLLSMNMAVENIVIATGLTHDEIADLQNADL